MEKQTKRVLLFIIIIIIIIGFGFGFGIDDFIQFIHFIVGCKGKQFRFEILEEFFRCVSRVFAIFIPCLFIH